MFEESSDVADKNDDMIEVGGDVFELFEDLHGLVTTVPKTTGRCAAAAALLLAGRATQQVDQAKISH